MKKSNGFTLLEVMIALTIFALMATTLSQTAAITVDNQIHIERKLLATWIAENEIIELRSTPFNNIKSSKKDIKFAEREWIINTEVAPKKQLPGMPSSLSLDLKSIVVSVSLKETSDDPVQTLTAYVAND
ncbi:type II secretion system minor pseudopilin GspI [Pseudomonas sp. HK3]